MKRKCIGLVMGLLTSLAGMADNPWTIYPYDVDGVTPSQQLTNAVTQATNGDTILFKQGTYQLDGVTAMDTGTYTSTVTGKGTYVMTKHTYVYLTNKALHFVGESDGKWDDGVVLRGNGRERFFMTTQNGSTFRNLTFENFASNDMPEIPAENDDNTFSSGGAVRFGSYNEANILSNCVFRGNIAYVAGAVTRANAFDCFFTNNVSMYFAGAAYTLRSTRCTFISNVCTNGGLRANGALWNGYGGAVYNLKGAWDSVFVGNMIRGLGGAVVLDSNMPISNCTFCGNATTAADTNLGGGALVARGNSRISDCIFDGNFANGRGGAFRTSSSFTAENTTFERCVFTNNYSRAFGGSAGGAVYDSRHASGNSPVLFLSCSFSGHTLNSGDNHLANAPDAQAAVAYCGSYSNCTFSSNRADAWSEADKGYLRPNGIVVGTADHHVQLTDCAFSNNYSRWCGIVRYADCTNTLFYCNELSGTGGVAYCCSAVDCRFVGNWRTSLSAATPTGDATESMLVRCDMDFGCLVNSVLVDCRIHTLTNSAAYCVFYGHNVATNCLVEDCDPATKWCGLIYRDGPIATKNVPGSDYVNCTFAGNIFTFMYHHRAEHGIYTSFKNCLFYNNRNALGGLIDALYKVMDEHGELTKLDSGFSLSNCVTGAAAMSNIAGDTWRDLGGNKVVAPENLGLAGAKAAELGVNKYSPLLKSPARGMGDASMFTASDLDYAGNLRLRDGLLDAGCFQCWLNPPGMMMIFR